MTVSTDLALDAPNDATGHARRHPCCAGPDDADPTAFATPVPHRPTLAQDPRAITGRNGPMTGKGEDQ